MISLHITILVLFFFNDTATTEIYTLSLHDALPISNRGPSAASGVVVSNVLPDSLGILGVVPRRVPRLSDRKSTRLNSSHLVISYAVFCLKKKKNIYAFHAYESG